MSTPKTMRPVQRYGEVTPRQCVSYEVVRRRYAVSQPAARQWVRRSLRRVIQLAEVYAATGQQDALGALIRRIERAAALASTVPIEQLVEAEARADGEGQLAMQHLLLQIRDPHPDTVRG